MRRAISQSIDRDALAEEVLGGTRSPLSAIVPSSIPGSQDGACDHCRTDPEGAAALLEEAEVELPDVLTFTHNRGATQAAIARRVARRRGGRAGRRGGATTARPRRVRARGRGPGRRRGSGSGGRSTRPSPGPTSIRCSTPGTSVSTTCRGTPTRRPTRSSTPAGPHPTRTPRSGRSGPPNDASSTPSPWSRWSRRTGRRSSRPRCRAWCGTPPAGSIWHACGWSRQRDPRRPCGAAPSVPPRWRACWLTATVPPLATRSGSRSRASGGTGRRARLRAVSSKEGGGSSPLSRTWQLDPSSSVETHRMSAPDRCRGRSPVPETHLTPSPAVLVRESPRALPEHVSTPGRTCSVAEDRSRATSAAVAWSPSSARAQNLHRHGGIGVTEPFADDLHRTPAPRERGAGSCGPCGRSWPCARRWSAGNTPRRRMSGPSVRQPSRRLPLASRPR